MDEVGKITESSERNPADSSWHLAANREDTLQAMLREIEDDEGLQALSEEVRQADNAMALGSAFVHRFSSASASRRFQPDIESPTFRLSGARQAPPAIGQHSVQTALTNWQASQILTKARKGSGKTGSFLSCTILLIVLQVAWSDLGGVPQGMSFCVEHASSCQRQRPSSSRDQHARGCET